MKTTLDPAKPIKMLKMFIYSQHKCIECIIWPEKDKQHHKKINWHPCASVTHRRCVKISPNESNLVWIGLKPAGKIIK